jgi:hypothetical protein
VARGLESCGRRKIEVGKNERWSKRGRIACASLMQVAEADELLSVISTPYCTEQWGEGTKYHDPLLPNLACVEQSCENVAVAGGYWWSTLHDPRSTNLGQAALLGGWGGRWGPERRQASVSLCKPLLLTNGSYCCRRLAFRLL